MSAKRSGLGRGLGALIQEVPKTEAAVTSSDEPSLNVPIGDIRKSPWQPRRVFDAGALRDLIASVKEHGVLQPLLVRKMEDHYELIAGERRFRAAQQANIKNIPVIIMDVSDQKALELALIENLQREDLNLIEEADGYQLLIDTFNLTQEQIAERVGKGRPTIANALRLLGLPDSVKTMIADNQLSPGHAKVLLSLENVKDREQLAERTLRENLSVRALEKFVAQLKRPPKKPRAEKSDIPTSHIQSLSEQLHRHLGTSVRISSSKTLANGKKARGTIDIDYYSPEDLDRLLGILGLQEEEL